MDFYSNILTDGQTIKSLYTDFFEEGGMIRSDTFVKTIEEEDPNEYLL